ncbi:hypothetical protein AW923_13450 [Pseudomonas aeruginosa]|uniref:hypothetical protein n=1 Tax=Pseudomonas aeruginosa TaxID=287 RepID=UPI000772AAF1|nr:hypothetical protein [Pseudomonas aeruginosa]KXE31484.1 hypothetical protein AW923_13450 [Pseudomonas aeruginosa]KXE34397.1 hypothetical protein AW922_13415 [Pseudomonas aeruginosa]
MSSTQHQLIEQCATRLRGIVEALDNIHDNTPHRWSTDLDDVHSSAESLLALIKDQAPARSEASFKEWLANELEGEDGQPVPAAVCDIALARRAFNHWPKLEQPAKVGGVRFSAGVSSRLVVEAAQRLYEFESTPEKEAERIERLQAFREQLDPLNLAPHAEAFNEAPAEVLKPEQAERPEVVAWSAERYVAGDHHSKPRLSFEQPYSTDRNVEALMTVAQHDRIVGALRADRDSWAEQAEQRLADWDEMRKERDAALARVAELERQEPVVRAYGVLPPFAEKVLAKLRRFYDCAEDFESGGVDIGRHWLDLLTQLGLLNRVQRSPALWEISQHGEDLLEAPVAQAQHSVPDDDMILQIFADNAEHSEQGAEHGYCIVREQHALAIARKLLAAAPGNSAQHSVPEKVRTLLSRAQCEIEHLAECLENVCEDEEDFDVREDVADGRVVAADIAHMLATAPGNSVPQAWLDVQAERRRQITAEGWTPEHDDEHADGQMARAAACYALAGSSAPNDGTAALLVSLAWPWDEQWWKPSTARRDLVKACTLALAEIERLDRAGISQSPQPGATTASS